MSSDFIKRKYLIVVLAAAVVGLVAFVGACALVYSTNWLSSDESDSYPVAESPLVPPHWSPDGTKIVLDSWWGPYLVDASSDGTELRKIVVGGHRERIYPRISPDGSRMVFSTRRYEVDEVGSELGVSNLDGSEYRRLTRSRGYQFGPKWSPDGARIAFISSFSASEGTHHSYGLYTMTANGTSPRKLVDSVRPAGPLAWSPDGRTIAFLGVDEYWPGGRHIYIVDRDGSNLAKLAQSFSPPDWSLYGKSIAFLRTGNRESLFVANPDGSGLRKIVDLDPDVTRERKRHEEPNPSWSPDGSEILLQNYPFVRVKVDGAAFGEGGAPYAVFVGPEDWRGAAASWAPDGSRIAITVQQAGGNDPDDREAFLLTMARDGSDKRALVKVNEYGEAYAVPNEPWDEEAGWVWHSPQEEISPGSTRTPTPASR